MEPMPSASFPVPEKFGNLVARHVEEMYRMGYFRALDESDFDHGHIVLVRGPKKYGSLKKLLERTGLILYHTDEHSGRWESQSQVPPEKRIQRSIVGYPDGRIRPAIELIAEKRRGALPYYASDGTVYDSDLAREEPGAWRKDNVLVRYRRSEKARPFGNQFILVPSAHGRFSVGTVRYDIYFEPPD